MGWYKTGPRPSKLPGQIQRGPTVRPNPTPERMDAIHAVAPTRHTSDPVIIPLADSNVRFAYPGIAWVNGPVHVLTTTQHDVQRSIHQQLGQSAFAGGPTMKTVAWTEPQIPRSYAASMTDHQEVQRPVTLDHDPGWAEGSAPNLPLKRNFPDPPVVALWA